MKDYDIIAFDAQYFLYRNMCALQSRTGYSVVDCLKNHIEGGSDDGYVITTYNFDEHDLVKQFFWTIVKLVRDSFSCNKILLFWDKPPYHKTKILPDFKGTRTHHSQELLDEWDIDNDPLGYLQEIENYRCHKILSASKYWIINELDKFGMPSVIVDGFEADDLAVVFSKIYSQSGPNIKSAICSSDSDWMYWIDQAVDFISFNKKEAWTYQDVLDECEGVPQKLGISVFEIKKWMDSTFYSHNDLKRTTNLGWKEFPQLVEEVRSGDFSNITDKVVFEKNMKSFDIESYDNYSDAVDSIISVITNPVKLSTDTFYYLKNKGFKVSKSYCDSYIKLFED